MPSLFSIQASLPGDWLELIHEELASGRFERLEQEVSSIYSQHPEEIAPSLDNIFRAFKETSVEQAKVIIWHRSMASVSHLAV